MGLPSTDLLLSPQHRVLVSPGKRQLLSGATEALLPAKKLTSLPGVFVDEGVRAVTYFHILLEAHEVIYANDAPTESLYLGTSALRLYPSFNALNCWAFSPRSPIRISNGPMQGLLCARNSKSA